MRGSLQLSLLFIALIFSFYLDQILAVNHLRKSSTRSIITQQTPTTRVYSSLPTLNSHPNNLIEDSETVLGNATHYFSDPSICKTLKNSVSNYLPEHSKLKQKWKLSQPNFDNLKTIHVTFKVYQACEFNSDKLPNLEDLNVRMEKFWEEYGIFTTEDKWINLFFKYPKLKKVNIVDIQRDSILHFSIFSNWDRLFALAVSYGQNIEASNLEGVTPLIDAILFKRHKMLTTLIKIGADINRLNRNEQTPLMAAAKKGRQRAIEILIQAGANVTFTNTFGKDALFYADFHGKRKVAKYLKQLIDERNA